MRYTFPKTVYSDSSSIDSPIKKQDKESVCTTQRVFLGHRYLLLFTGMMLMGTVIEVSAAQVYIGKDSATLIKEHPVPERCFGIALHNLVTDKTGSGMDIMVDGYIRNTEFFIENERLGDPRLPAHTIPYEQIALFHIPYPQKSNTERWALRPHMLFPRENTTGQTVWLLLTGGTPYVGTPPHERVDTRQFIYTDTIRQSASEKVPIVRIKTNFCGFKPKSCFAKIEWDR